MSFNVNWPAFSKEFIDKAKTQLTVALNHGDSKPPNIVGRIKVTDLDMGTKAPDLEILEISELLEDRFKGIFKLVYNGDAFINIQTKVQANPLTVHERERSLRIRQGMLAAHRPFVVPMQIRISNVKLRGIIVLVIDQERGITLVFKNDPLEKVDVNSSFDNVPNIRRFLQAQIEAQLRNLFQDDLPQMVHQLSRILLAKKNGVDGEFGVGSNNAIAVPNSSGGGHNFGNTSSNGMHDMGPAFGRHASRSPLPAIPYGTSAVSGPPHYYKDEAYTHAQPSYSDRMHLSSQDHLSASHQRYAQPYGMAGSAMSTLDGSDGPGEPPRRPSLSSSAGGNSGYGYAPGNGYNTRRGSMYNHTSNDYGNAMTNRNDRYNNYRESVGSGSGYSHANGYPGEYHGDDERYSSEDVWRWREYGMSSSPTGTSMPARMYGHDNRNLPHHQKWSGNEPVFGSVIGPDGFPTDIEISGSGGVVLNRSLSQTGQLDALDLGLNNLLLEDRGMMGSREHRRSGPAAPSSTLTSSIATPVIDIPMDAHRNAPAGLGSITGMHLTRPPADGSGGPLSASIHGAFNSSSGVSDTNHRMDHASAQSQHYQPSQLPYGNTAAVGLMDTLRRNADYGRMIFSPPPLPQTGSGAQPNLPLRLQSTVSSAVHERDVMRSPSPSFSGLSESPAGRDDGYTGNLSILNAVGGNNVAMDSGAEFDTGRSAWTSPQQSQSRPPNISVYMHRQGQIHDGMVWRRPVAISPTSIAHQTQQAHHPPARSQPHSRSSTVHDESRSGSGVRPHRLYAASEGDSIGSGSASFVRHQHRRVTRRSVNNGHDHHDERHRQHSSHHDHTLHEQDHLNHHNHNQHHHRHHHGQSSHQSPSRTILKPTDHEVAAHLANLMSSNSTISPHSQGLEHYMYRAGAPGGASLSSSHNGGF